jgi:hypothetical protein
MVEYVFIDAVYEGLRQWGCGQGLLCAWAICRVGFPRNSGQREKKV